MCLPDMVSDRTEALLSGNPGDPGRGMADVIAAGAAAYKALGLKGIAAVPCNTFHAGPIWSSFNARLDETGVNVQLINMIEETVSTVKELVQPGGTVGLLSTTGSRRIGLYSGPLSAAGFKILEAEDQAAVHEIIYNTEWGLKTAPPVSGKSRQKVIREIDRLMERGADLVILGCTEFPLAFDGENRPGKLLDPMESLAKKLVKTVDPAKLKKTD